MLIVTRIRKTASTSFGAALKIRPVSHIGGFEVQQYGGPNHLCWKPIRVIPDDEWDASFCVAWIRNPFDRLVSHTLHVYGHKNVANRMCQVLATLRSRLSIWDVLKQGDIRSNAHKNVVHCTPFTDPVYRLASHDFIGRFENIEQDMQRLRDLHPEWFGELGRRKVTKGRKHYREYFNERAKQLALQVYAKDCEEYGYSF